MTTTNNRVRQAFEEGRIIRRRDDDPSEGDLDGGEVWFNTSDDDWRGYDGTDFVTFDTTADS